MQLVSGGLLVWPIIILKFSTGVENSYVEADASSWIPLENTWVGHMEPLIVKTMLQSKLVTYVGIPEIYLQLNVIQKSMVVDSSPKLTHGNWIKEQSAGSDVNIIIQLVKSDKLKKYVAKETDSSRIQVFLKYHKDLFLRNGLLYWSVLLRSIKDQFLNLCYPRVSFAK